MEGPIPLCGSPLLVPSLHSSQMVKKPLYVYDLDTFKAPCNPNANIVCVLLDTAVDTPANQMKRRVRTPNFNTSYPSFLSSKFALAWTVFCN